MLIDYAQFFPISMKKMRTLYETILCDTQIKSWKNMLLIKLEWKDKIVKVREKVSTFGITNFGADSYGLGTIYCLNILFGLSYYRYF